MDEFVLLAEFIEALGEDGVEIWICSGAGEIMKSSGEPEPVLVVERGCVLLDGRTEFTTPLIVGHLGSRDAQDTDLWGEPSFLIEFVECGDELARSEVARCSEDDDDAWIGTVLRGLPWHGGVSVGVLSGESGVGGGVVRFGMIGAVIR